MFLKKLICYSMLSIVNRTKVAASINLPQLSFYIFFLQKLLMASQIFMLTSLIIF
jgi:hypothetical protein